MTKELVLQSLIETRDVSSAQEIMLNAGLSIDDPDVVHAMSYNPWVSWNMLRSPRPKLSWRHEILTDSDGFDRIVVFRSDSAIWSVELPDPGPMRDSVIEAVSGVMGRLTYQMGKITVIRDHPIPKVQDWLDNAAVFGTATARLDS